MVDLETLRSEQAKDRAPPSHQMISETVVHPITPLKICGCSLCEDQFYRRAVKPKFSGYSRFSPSDVKELTEHQYFVCDMRVQAFIFKLRTWGKSQSLAHRNESVLNNRLLPQKSCTCLGSKRLNSTQLYSKSWFSMKSPRR